MGRLSLSPGGMKVDGVQGIRAVPPDTRFELFFLTMLFIDKGHYAKKSKQSILGSFLHPFSVRNLDVGVCSQIRWSARLREKRPRT